MIGLEYFGLSSSSQGLKFARWQCMAPLKGKLKKGKGFVERLRVVDRLGNGYTLCVLRDLNGWVGDRLRGVLSSKRK